MTTKTLPVASQASLWGISQNPAAPVLALPGVSEAILDRPDQFPMIDAAPDPRGATWLGFTLDHDENAAAAAFLRRYGQAPRYVFENLGLLLVGPVPGLEGGAS